MRKKLDNISHGKPSAEPSSLKEPNIRKDMKKNTINLTESQLRNMIAESVKKVLNEISIDTLRKAQDKAFKDYEDTMWPDSPNYDEDFSNKRFRQYNAFKDRIHQLNSKGGKQVYYTVIPGVSGFYDGEVKKVYMTPDEAMRYADEHNGNIYTSYVEAEKNSQYLS